MKVINNIKVDLLTADSINRMCMNPLTADIGYH